MSDLPTHTLKTWPEPFQAILDDRKSFEVRRNDRAFAVGDLLRLLEWDPASEAYTGRGDEARVTYIVPGGSWGLPADLCVLGIRRAVDPASRVADLEAQLAAAVAAMREAAARIVMREAANYETAIQKAIGDPAQLGRWGDCRDELVELATEIRALPAAAARTDSPASAPTPVAAPEVVAVSTFTRPFDAEAALVAGRSLVTSADGPVDVLDVFDTMIAAGRKP